MSGYITKTDLKARGWSDSLIAGLLGDHDQERRNPRYRSAAPMRLWLLERVIAGEEHAVFKNYQASRAKRSTASLATADRKRRELRQQVADLEITVPRCEASEILFASLSEWRSYQTSRGRDACGSDAPPNERQRWAVNYIRHNLTCYDETLYLDLAGNIGKREAARLLKERVLESIAEIYPEFAEEAQRQRWQTADQYVEGL